MRRGAAWRHHWRAVPVTRASGHDCQQTSRRAVAWRRHSAPHRRPEPCL